MLFRSDIYGNLGVVLNLLADKLKDIHTAEEAVKVLKKAITMSHQYKIKTLDVGILEMNLGIALETWGKLEKNATILQQSINANENALAIFTKKDVPQLWARTYNSLGMTQDSLARLLENTTLLQSSIQSYKNALEVWSLEQYPDRKSVV